MCFRTARQRREGVGLLFLGLVIVTWVAQSELAQFIQVGRSLCAFALPIQNLVAVADHAAHWAGAINNAGRKLQQTLFPDVVQSRLCCFDAAGGAARVSHLREGRATLPAFARERLNACCGV